MKRTLSLALALMFVLALAGTALAEAKFTAKDKKLITFEGENVGYFYALIENTGDAAGFVDNGSLVGFVDGDNILFTESYVSTAPYRQWLEPGETAYVRESIYEDTLKTTAVADYKFSVKPYSYGTEYVSYPAQAEPVTFDVSSYSNYVYVTFTNTTDKVLYDYTVVVAAYDANDALCYVGSDSSSSVGIHPGSTVTFKLYIDSNLPSYYLRNGITFAKTDAAVYVEK